MTCYTTRKQEMEPLPVFYLRNFIFYIQVRNIIEFRI